MDETMFMTGVFELSSAGDQDKLMHTSVRLSPTAVVFCKVSLGGMRVRASVAPIVVASASAYRSCGGRVLHALPLLVRCYVACQLGRTHYYDFCRNVFAVDLRETGRCKLTAHVHIVYR